MERFLWGVGLTDGKGEWLGCEDEVMHACAEGIVWREISRAADSEPSFLRDTLLLVCFAAHVPL